MPMSNPPSRPRPWLSIAVKAAILHAVIVGGWLVAAGPEGGVAIGQGLLVLAGSGAIFAYLAYALRRVQTRTEALSGERKSDGQQEDTRERDQRLRAICHDMRTPLTAILGFIELLQEDQSLNDTARRKVETINRESVKLQQLFDEFLEARRPAPPATGLTNAAPESPGTAGSAAAGDERCAR